MRSVFFLCVISFMQWSDQRSTPEDDHYVAAVVEFEIGGEVEYNLERYGQLIKEAAKKKADIVVFPETTLASSHSISIPMYGMLKDYPVPALEPSYYDNILVSLSAAARQNQIYLVVNIPELLDCTSAKTIGENCMNQKKYIFNSNIVFDRNGTIIDRYRKINLFKERGTTPSLSQDLGVFETDFGVKFGHFICFDILFQRPAEQLTQKLGLNNLIITTMWFSEMPFLTATQIQEAYAYSKNINFLAAGANNVGAGSGGSGIYSGKAGALVSIMPMTRTTKVLVEKVPKAPGRVNWTYSGHQRDRSNGPDNLNTVKDISIPSHETRILVAGYQEFELSHNEVVCFFRIRMKPQNGLNKYTYRAAAFDGVRPTGGDTTQVGGMRTCSIYACLDDTKDTCGKRFKTRTNDSTPKFEELSIRCQAPAPTLDVLTSTATSSYYPVSLNTWVMPLNTNDYEVHTYNNKKFHIVYDINLINTEVELLSFGIWARVYDKDNNMESSGNILWIFIVVILFILLTCIVFRTRICSKKRPKFY